MNETHFLQVGNMFGLIQLLIITEKIQNSVFIRPHQNIANMEIKRMIFSISA